LPPPSVIVAERRLMMPARSWAEIVRTSDVDMAIMIG
jgi:hypothetical protein